MLNASSTMHNKNNQSSEIPYFFKNLEEANANKYPSEKKVRFLSNYSGYKYDEDVMETQKKKQNYKPSDVSIGRYYLETIYDNHNNHNRSNDTISSNFLI